MKQHLIASVCLAACQLGWAAPGLPVLKEGLWEVVVQHQHEPAPPPVKVLQCVDKATSSLMLMSPFSGQEGCRMPQVKKSGAGYSVQTRCTVHDVKVFTKAQLQGDFSSHYTGSSETRYASTKIQQPPAQKFEGRWQGGCSPGMKPGDLKLPNGITVNLPERAAASAKEKSHDHSAPGHKH